MKQKFIEEQLCSSSLRNLFRFFMLLSNKTAISICIRNAHFSLNKQEAAPMLVTMAHEPKIAKKSQCWKA